MAEVEGKLLTCDICGATVFLKLGETKEYDGGFTRVREYEKKPEGWNSIHFGKVVHSTLCPECFGRMEDAMVACIRGIEE